MGRDTRPCLDPSCRASDMPHAIHYCNVPRCPDSQVPNHKHDVSISAIEEKKREYARLKQEQAELDKIIDEASENLERLTAKAWALYDNLGWLEMEIAEAEEMV